MRTNLDLKDNNSTFEGCVQLDFGRKVAKKNRQNYCVVNCVKNTTTAEQFCHDILKSDIKRAKAFV
ncbi:MAG: hypothetical protein ACJAVF_003666, partial [Paraglaciecola sp.]